MLDEIIVVFSDRVVQERELEYGHSIHLVAEYWLICKHARLLHGLFLLIFKMFLRHCVWKALILF